MEIRIKLNDREILSIQFGRDLIYAKNLYLISIIKEEYRNRKVIHAAFLKGFFKKHIIGRKII